MDGPPSFTSMVPMTKLQLSDPLTDTSYNSEQQPSVGSVAKAQVQLSDQLTDTSYNNEQPPSVGSVAMAELELSDQHTDSETSYNNEQAPSMTMVEDRGDSQSAGDSCSYNAPPSLTDLAGRDASFTGPDPMDTDNNSASMTVFKGHTSKNFKTKMRGYDDDEASTIDPELSYIDEKLQDVLGHLVKEFEDDLVKEFEGGVSVEKLGEKFGGYGTFLPTYPHFRSYPH